MSQLSGSQLLTAGAGQFRAGQGASGQVAAAFARVEKAAKDTSSSLDVAGTVLKRFGLGLAGLVTAGLRGTAELNQLTFAFQRLTREIAGTFAPQIHAVIGLFHQLADALKSVSGEGQQRLRTLGGAAAGAALGAKLGGGLGALAGGAVGVLSGSESGRESLARIARVLADLFGKLAEVITPVIELFGKLAAGILDAIGKIADAITTFFKKGQLFAGQSDAQLREQLAQAERQAEWNPIARSAAEVIRAELEKRQGKAEGGEKTGLTLAGGGTFDPRQLIQRIQERSLQSDYARQTAENTKASRGDLKDLRDTLMKLWDFLRNLGTQRRPENA